VENIRTRRKVCPSATLYATGRTTDLGVNPENRSLKIKHRIAARRTTQISQSLLHLKTIQARNCIFWK
jgi:hypothetical protein